MRPAVLEEHDRPHRDLRARQFERHAGASGHRDEAAPVRIAAVDGRLHQRRVRDRLGGPPRLVARRAAGHVHGHELGRALAAADDAERQLETDAREPLQKRAVGRLVDDAAARAVGEERHAVVRRALAVHRDRVERVVDRGTERAVEQRLRHRRVRRHEAEHRRHHRLDHPGAFGHPADRDPRAAEIDRGGRLLGERIGRHDGARGHRTLIGAERAHRQRQPGADLLDRQCDADDAGRRDEHLFGRAADQPGGLRGHVARDLQPFVARARVGAPAVDDDGARHAARAREVLARDEHGRRLGAVGREDRGRRRRRIRDEEREVRVAVRLDAGADAGRAEAARRGDAPLRSRPRHA